MGLIHNVQFVGKNMEKNIINENKINFKKYRSVKREWLNDYFEN